MARRHGCAVVVHNRESDEDMQRILRDEGDGLRIVLHAFGGAPELAALTDQLDVYFGVGGFLTFKNHPLSKHVHALPRETLLLETDAPYLSPHPLRGRRNEPAHVEIVARRLAALLETSLEEVAALTTRNFARFIGDTHGDAGSDPPSET